jgi:DNA-binding MarR family transcriptional regulator
MKYEQGKQLEEFNRLYREMDQIYHGLAVRMGLSDSAFIILYTIAELGEGCLQKDIAAWCSLSRQTVNSSIQNLKAQGFLSLDSGKGREKEIFLTEEGKGIVEEKIFPVMELEQSVFEEMSPKECQEMLKLMGKYVGKFRKKVEECGQE